MSQTADRTPRRGWATIEEIQAALDRSARQCIEEHRREGLPMCVLRDGKVVWISAEEALTGLEKRLQEKAGDASPAA